MTLPRSSSSAPTFAASLNAPMNGSSVSVFGKPSGPPPRAEKPDVDETARYAALLRSAATVPLAPASFENDSTAIGVVPSPRAGDDAGAATAPTIANPMMHAARRCSPRPLTISLTEESLPPDEPIGLHRCSSRHRAAASVRTGEDARCRGTRRAQRHSHAQVSERQLQRSHGSDQIALRERSHIADAEDLAFHLLLAAADD